MPAWTEAGILRLTDRLNAVSCMDGWAVTGVEPYTVLAYVDYAWVEAPVYAAMATRITDEDTARALSHEPGCICIRYDVYVKDHLRRLSQRLAELAMTKEFKRYINEKS